MKLFTIAWFLAAALLAVSCSSADQLSEATPTTGVASGPTPEPTRAYANVPTDAIASVLPATPVSFEELPESAWELLDLGPVRMLPDVLAEGAPSLSDQKLVEVWDEYIRGTRHLVGGARGEDWSFCDNRTGTATAFLTDLWRFDWEIVPDPSGSGNSVKLSSSNIELIERGGGGHFRTPIIIEVREGVMRLTSLTIDTTGRLDDPSLVTELNGECPVPE